VKEKLLELVTEEISAVLTHRRMGAVFSLSRFEAAFDFHIDSGLFLFVSVEPANPRVYLVRRRMRDLAKASNQLTPFLSILRRYLTGAIVTDISKDLNERLLTLNFLARSEAGDDVLYRLIVQMTGRSANLFMLDQDRVIIDAFRASELEGQRPGDKYFLPARTSPRFESKPVSLDIPGGVSVSEFLDHQYQEEEKSRQFHQRASTERRKLDQQIGRREKLIQQLKNDLTEHGDAERWKQFGDLLLANNSTAVINGNKVLVKNFFENDAPEMEIGIDENESVTEAAERYYKRYTKARNAAAEVFRRRATVETELVELRKKKELLEAAIASRDESFFKTTEINSARREKKRIAGGFSGARTFISSDGIEILVGKKAVDNDQLTFRIARSLDFWLHAADYPGSHVVIRNPNRQADIPQRTLIESAQLAAFYSNAKTQPKAAVNYTQKKFVTKPKGGAPGLARLSKFKTILVEPQVPPGVTKKE
jgi:predicted ribosome quality control (RQC) complex YloA/Tae2 family protein